MRTIGRHAGIARNNSFKSELPKLATKAGQTPLYDNRVIMRKIDMRGRQFCISFFVSTNYLSF